MCSDTPAHLLKIEPRVEPIAEATLMLRSEFRQPGSAGKSPLIGQLLHKVRSTVETPMPSLSYCCCRNFLFLSTSTAPRRDSTLIFLTSCLPRIIATHHHKVRLSTWFPRRESLRILSSAKRSKRVRYPIPITYANLVANLCYAVEVKGETNKDGGGSGQWSAWKVCL